MELNLEFPLTQDPPKSSILVVRDVDVNGVGALRRQHIQRLQKQHSFILQTHEPQIPEAVHGLYSEELLSCLQWLRPVKIVLGPPLDVLGEQKALFLRLFPRTHEALGLASLRVVESYLDEMIWSSWLLQDHWRYFVGFLRKKFPDNKKLHEVAHWEWVRAWLEVQPFDGWLTSEGFVKLDPSLQCVNLDESALALNRDPGLYALFFSPQGGIQDRKLDIYEAHLLDLLQEERKFSVSQLAEMAQLFKTAAEGISVKEWEEKIRGLLKLGIFNLKE